MNKTSPYETNVATLRRALEDPAINTFEHEMNWPRLQMMLPESVHSILDFGCGPGNFTRALAERYTHAEVIGVDASQAILPSSSSPSVLFKRWDGAIRKWEWGNKFDLVLAKMSLHYVVDYRQVLHNLRYVLHNNGWFVLSVPHPRDSMLYNTRKSSDGNAYMLAGRIIRQIGQSGIEAGMMHRSMSEWIMQTQAALPSNYYVALDEVCSDRVPVRLNMAFIPDHEQLKTVISRLQDGK